MTGLRVPINLVGGFNQNKFNPCLTFIQRPGNLGHNCKMVYLVVMCTFTRINYHDILSQVQMEGFPC